MKPVFRLQAKRAFSMTPFEYDVMAKYPTTAKLSLLRMWALSPIDLDLAYMTKVTDATLEGGLWDRIDEATRARKAGRAFHTAPPSTSWPPPAPGSPTATTSANGAVHPSPLPPYPSASLLRPVPF